MFCIHSVDSKHPPRGAKRTVLLTIIMSSAHKPSPVAMQQLEEWPLLSPRPSPQSFDERSGSLAKSSGGLSSNPETTQEALAQGPLTAHIHHSNALRLFLSYLRSSPLGLTIAVKVIDQLKQWPCGRCLLTCLRHSSPAKSSRDCRQMLSEIMWQS